MLLSLLAATESLSETAWRHLSTTWLSERNAGENLSTFLIRGDYLAPSAEQSLDWLNRGLIALPNAESLFHLGGLQRFSEKFGVASSSGPPHLSSQVCTAYTKTTRPISAQPERRKLLPGESASDVTPTQAVEIVYSESITPLTRPKTPGDMPQLGSLLGKCLLIELLGKGGAGMVFRAIHQGLNINVAIKVLHADILDRPEAYQQLKSEARLLAQLNHPNVVRVLDFEDDARFPYFVMECVEGMNLADLIRQAGSLTPTQAVRIAIQTVEALKAAWNMGIVHRDIKPANILMTRDGCVKLADLGVAMVSDTPSPVGLARTGTVSKSEVVGTAAYMAPEQFVAAGSVDFRADIYSLGATLYHAVTGRLPFQAGSLGLMILKHANEKPIPPRQLMPTCPERLSELVLTMLAKNPADRFPGYPELLTALRQAGESLATPAPVRSSGGLSSIFRSIVGPTHRTTIRQAVASTEFT